MPRAILDENVSLQVADRLVVFGYEIFSIARRPTKGMGDEDVFTLVTEGSCLLVTRDTHFTNPIRFPPSKTGGILYITPGNLQGHEEADLVERFLRTHAPTDFAGRLVFASPTSITIR